MATYGTLADFLTRFPAASRVSSAEINSYFLPSASAWTEEHFAARFVIPFSSNNVTVPEIVYERVWGQILLRALGKTEEAKTLMEDLESRITRINCGMAGMSTTSGALFASEQNPATQNQVFDALAGYQPTFTLGTPFAQREDPNRENYDLSQRGFHPTEP